jgi:hypothetical protein
MAKQFKKRERFKNLEVLRRLRERPGERYRSRVFFRQWEAAHNDWEGQNARFQASFFASKRHLEKSMYRGICRFSRWFFHPIWRKAGKRICQLHLLGEDARADNLDPQPKRLGIMWYVD